MQVVKYRQYSQVKPLQWHEILQQELNQVGYFVRPIGCEHWQIVDANEKPTGWELHKDELNWNSPKSENQIFTAHLNLKTALFQYEADQKTLFIGSPDMSFFFMFIQMK